MRIMNKYQLSQVDVGDAYFTEAPEAFLTPSTDTKDYAQWFAGHPYKTYIDHLLVKLHSERAHTFIVGLSLYAAASTLNSYISDSANKYGPALKELTNTVIEEALKYDWQEIRETERDETQTTTDAEAEDQDSRSSIQQSESDPATDTNLRKRNDTPQAGNNPNLTSDTYLSQSERNEATIGARMNITDVEDVVTRVIGARLRTVNTTADPALNYTATRRLTSLPHIAAALDSIQDIYHRWLQEVDARNLTL